MALIDEMSPKQLILMHNETNREMILKRLDEAEPLTANTASAPNAPGSAAKPIPGAR
jgi:hypothetical protein